MDGRPFIKCLQLYSRFGHISYSFLHRSIYLTDILIKTSKRWLLFSRDELLHQEASYLVIKQSNQIIFDFTIITIDDHVVFNKYLFISYMVY